MSLYIFVFLLLVYFVFHSVLASHKVKLFLIGKVISKKYYRLAFNIVAILTLIPILYIFVKMDSPYLFDSPIVSTLGAGCSIFGILLLLYALSQYNLAEFSGLQQMRTEAEPSPEVLKTTGFNALVRHPLYFAGLIITCGGFVYSPSVKILAAAIIATLYLYFGTKLEEQKLIVEFGEEYKIYQDKVGMLIPFIK